MGCSPDMMGGSCGAGMQACGSGCVPLGSPCEGADAGMGDATLSGLSVSGGPLSPAFSPGTTMYTVQVGFLVGSVQVTATTADSQATLQINGQTASSGAASGPIALQAGPTVIAVLVQAAGAAQQSYTVVVSRRPSASDYLKASNTGALDAFGTSVFLSGDGNTLAVGADDEDSNATGVNGNQADNSSGGSGAVYVFVRSGTTWTQEAYVKASNTGGGDAFGASVALSWDGNTLAVGAPGEASKATGVNGNQTDNSALASGAVYVFVRDGTTWTQQAYVKASNTEGADYFGASVSLSWDGNTLAVGAYGEDSNATGVDGNQADNRASMSGANYVFVRSGSVWTQQAYVKASNPAAADNFGRSMSLSGDGNTLAVGAFFEASNATGVNGDQANDIAPSSGAVYVFVRNGTVWAQQAYVKASNTGAGDYFGYSVSLSGDGNTLAVGAHHEASNATGVNGNAANNNASGSGAVYVFTRSGAVWQQQAYVKASNTAANAYFGDSVSLSGDGNTLAVGAYGASGGGAAYGFARSGSIWTQQALIKGSNTGGADLFGNSVTLSGDGNTLTVGAYQEDSNATGINGNQADNSATDSGAVYIFR